MDIGTLEQHLLDQIRQYCADEMKEWTIERIGHYPFRGSTCWVVLLRRGEEMRERLFTEQQSAGGMILPLSPIYHVESSDLQGRNV